MMPAPVMLRSATMMARPGRVVVGPDAGFTLIEMLVVVVILGLSLGIAAGFMPRRNTTLELANATSRIAGVLRHARATAIADDRTVAFVVNSDGHGFRLDNRPVTFGPAVFMAMVDRQPVLFAPDGSTSGGLLRIAVENKVREIQIDWLTGRVTVSGS